MYRKSLITSIIAKSAIAASLATSVLAEDVNIFQPSGSSGDYGVASNWTLQGSPDDHHVPNSGERIVIKQGKTCNVNVDTNPVFAIDVESSAVFDVLPGKMAFIASGGGAAPTSTIDGIIYLNREATGDRSKLHIRYDHNFDGNGKICGGLVDSEIEIFSGTTSSDILIEGYLTITGGGDEFVNTGTVHAKYPGGVVGMGEIWVSLISIEDDTTAQWIATADARIRIDGGQSEPMDLQGDFLLDDGILEVDYPGMVTSGGLSCVNDCTLDFSNLFNDFDNPADPVVFSGTPGT